MKKLLTILSLTAVALLLMPRAQAEDKFNIRKVDFDHVREVTNNSKSIYHFPKLLRLFNSNDTSMTIEAYRITPLHVFLPPYQDFYKDYKY